MVPAISFVLGGASSGKSAWAEAFVSRFDLAKVYVATAEALDADIATKIKRHRRKRAGNGWRTIEAPHDLARNLAQIEPEEIGLVDCATFWLTNTMFTDRPWNEALDELIDTIERCPAPLVIVSNELGHGTEPLDATTRAYRRAHGEMNQKLAAISDLAVLITAGLPLVLKGQLPE